MYPGSSLGVQKAAIDRRSLTRIICLENLIYCYSLGYYPQTTGAAYTRNQQLTGNDFEAMVIAQIDP